MNSWKARYEALERSHVIELEEVRSSIDQQRRSQLDKQVRELTVKFNMERGQLEAEIKRLKDFIEARNRDSEELKVQITRLQQQLQEMASKTSHVRELEQRAQDY